MEEHSNGLPIVTNDEVERILPIGACVPVVERAYIDVGRGAAIDAPRRNFSVSFGKNKEYFLKSWQALYPFGGIAAVRLTSGVLQLDQWGERPIAEQLPSARGDQYVGFVILFSIESGLPIGIIHDARLAQMATSVPVGLAAKYLARPDSKVLTVLGAGAQAFQQVQAIAAVRRLDEVRVFSPRSEHRQAFAKKLNDCIPARVVAVPDKRRALIDTDILVLASSSLIPIIDVDSIRPGTHVSITRLSEAPSEIYDSAEVLVTSGFHRSQAHFVGDSGAMWRSRPIISSSATARVATLMDVIIDVAAGRGNSEQITVYGPLREYSPGIAYAALGKELLDRMHGNVSRTLKLEWLLQSRRS